MGVQESQDSLRVAQGKKPNTLHLKTEGKGLGRKRWIAITLKSHGLQKRQGIPKEGRTYTSLATARALSASEVPWEHKKLHQPVLTQVHTSRQTHLLVSYTHTYIHARMHVHMPVSIRVRPASGCRDESAVRSTGCSS